MQEQQIETPVRDEYEAMQKQTTRGFAKIPHILMFVLAVIASYVIGHTAFNPLMNAWDRLTTDKVEAARADALWQQVMDAEVGTLFELRDGTVCRVNQQHAGQFPLFYSCQNSYVSQDRLSKIIGVHPIGTERWKELNAIYDDGAS